MALSFIEFKAKSAQDQTLNTGCAVYELTKDQVFLGKFKNATSFNAMIEAGLIMKASSKADLKKPIPVILLDEDGVELPLSSEDITNFLRD